MTHPTDALRLVPDDHLAALIQQADDGFGYSMEMVRLVDGVRTYRLKIEGQETVEITDGDDNDYDAQQACYRLINAAKNKVRADAVRTALAAAPASPLPGGGWQDISTAPRTGEEFQAWWKGTWQPRARFDPEYGSFQLWGRTDFDTEGWEVFEIDGYWQPQPAAPTGEPK